MEASKGKKLRLKYEKTSMAKYVSHLDLAAAMHRAFLRADVPLKYSSGFNPHPYISVALPLKVGDESLCELLDFAVSDDFAPDESLSERLSGVMAKGLRAVDVYMPTRKFSEIAWIDLQGVLYYNQMQRGLVSGLTKRFSQQSIIITKKTKSGLSDIDIKPHVLDVEFKELADGINISIKISAVNPSLNSENLLSALKDEYKWLMPDFYKFTRTEFYDSSLTVFK